MSKKQKKVCWISLSALALVAVVVVSIVTACSTNTKSSGGNAINTDNRSATSLFGGSRYTVDDISVVPEFSLLDGSPLVSQLKLRITGPTGKLALFYREPDGYVGKAYFSMNKATEIISVPISHDATLTGGELSLVLKTDEDKPTSVWEKKVAFVAAKKSMNKTPVNLCRLQE